jgi:phage tail protein X
MRKYLSILLTCLYPFAANAQGNRINLSDSAVISLLTCDPVDDMAYTVYGHTAIRVNDPENSIDFVYNYGMFDFSSPNFLYRFARGELNYYLGGNYFADFFEEYYSRKSGITEQTLNLTKEEKQKILDALQINYLPENRTYLYNFLFDNCSTRPRILFEKNISGTIEYPEILPQTTFRTVVHRCNRNHRWLTFGIDLALGAPLDSPIGQKPQLFLPEYLMQVFGKAKTVMPDGTARNLVSATRILAPSYPIADKPLDSNPAVILWLFFAAVLLISLLELRCKRYFRAVDFIMFSVYGLTGCMIFFLSFISIHPAVFPNYSIIWAHPLHLVLAVSLFIKPLKGFVKYWMLVNGIILLLFMAGWNLFPQQFNPAFFPLVLSLCTRSLLKFFRKSVF